MISRYKQKQARFLKCKALLVLYADSQGFCLVEYEGCLMSRRKSRGGKRYVDGVHMRFSTHYDRMGSDFVLYDTQTGEPVYDGDDERWLQLGMFWESLGSLCKWGGRFGDAGHFSLSHNGRR